MKRFISAALTLAVTTILIPVVQASVANAEPCPPTITFVVGGTGDPTSTHAPMVPAGPRVNITYPASISPVGGSVSADESIRLGVAALSAAVDAFRVLCPDSRITILGYSLGAVVVSQVCDGLPARNITCVTYGNPRRQGGGVMGVLPTFIPGFHFDGVREAPADGPVVVEVCNPRDLYCDTPNPVQDPLKFLDKAIGTYLQGQHWYPVNPVGPVLPSLPGPVAPDLRALDDAARGLVPVAPVRFGGPYVPTAVGDWLPPVVAGVLPPVVRDFVPPPVFPPLPKIPGLN